MDLNLADDFDTFDGLESGVYYSRTASGFADGVAVARALQRATLKHQMMSGSALKSAEVVWHIPDSLLTPTVPKVGDVWAASDGVRWVVKRLEFQTLGTRWRLTTQREVG